MTCCSIIPAGCFSSARCRAFAAACGLIWNCSTVHPRPDFKRRILQAFTDGNTHRPRSTFGNVNADVLEHYDPSFVRDDFVEIILNNSWPE